MVIIEERQPAIVDNRQRELPSFCNVPHCKKTARPCALDDLSKFNDIAKRCIESWKNNV